MESTLVHLTDAQLEFFSMVIFNCALVICFSIGWLCHEMGAK